MRPSPFFAIALVLWLTACSDESDGGHATGGTGGAAGSGASGGSGGTGGGSGSGNPDASGGSSGTAGSGGVDGGGSAGASGASGSSGSGGSPGVRRVFVSSTTHDGDFGGIAGLDAYCQSLADQTTLGGTWLAWASDTNTSAAARLTHSTVPYVLVGGGQLAADWADLTDGSLALPIDRDETGSTLPPAETTRVWTGTSSDGVAYGGNCANWTTDSSGGVFGSTLASDSEWSFESGNTCENLDRVYCFEN